MIPYEIDLTMSLQRSSNDGRTWSTVETWDTSDYGSAALEEGRFVLSGYSYRVKATAEIYDESGDLIEEESVNHLLKSIDTSIFILLLFQNERGFLPRPFLFQILSRS